MTSDRPRYSVGLDFGTGSARALLVDMASGDEAAEAVEDYPHGVIDERLPEGGCVLPPDWALQDADDYLAVLNRLIPRVLHGAGVEADDVRGIGVDFTACTLIPCRRDGSPLSRDPEWRGQPHAWTKLWKHHAAQSEADRINELGRRRGERFLDRCGGATSSEWLLAKAWQVLNEAPELYDQAATFVDAGDWLVWQLTGNLTRSACQAGYKGLWSAEDGWPCDEFLSELDPRLSGFFSARVAGPVLPVGQRAGGLTEEMAARTGLRAGTPVATAVIDAHAALPGAGVTSPGSMLLILGTSGCQIILSERGRTFPGVAGIVRDGIIPGLYGYEAGQPATGDMMNWLRRQAVPAATEEEAARRGLAVLDLLAERAESLKPGESGLLALDWWNGNRSILMDAGLSGLIVGLTLETKPEEIFRCLLESTAFGAAIILKNLDDHGVAARDVIAAGGMAVRNQLSLQIYADVCNRPIRLARSSQTCALGSAIYGAAAAGVDGGGWATVEEAAQRMGGVGPQTYHPDPAAVQTYRRLFEIWRRLHDHFGLGGEPAMRELREILLQAHAP